MKMQLRSRIDAKKQINLIYHGEYVRQVNLREETELNRQMASSGWKDETSKHH